MSRRLLPPLAAAVAALALMWMGYALLRGPDGIGKVRDLRAQIAAQQRDNAELRMANQFARERVAGLKTDPARIEQIARSRLLMIKKGEVFIAAPAE